MILSLLIEIMTEIIAEHLKKIQNVLQLIINTSFLLITSEFHWKAVEMSDSFPTLFLEFCVFEY